MDLITINNPSSDDTFGILENPLKATPNGYEPTDFMLLKSFSFVYLFVTYGKYPATSESLTDNCKDIGMADYTCYFMLNSAIESMPDLFFV